MHTRVKSYKLGIEKFLTSKGNPIYRNIVIAYTDEIISVVKLDLNTDDLSVIIDEILDTYRRFSLSQG